MLLRRVLLALALFLPAGASVAAGPGVPVSGRTLVEDLRKGGFIVFFRHTKTLPEHAHEAQMRRDGRWRADDCATQRNLSEEGYREARMQGELLRQLGIPHDKAYASAACRARIHAEWVVDQVELLDVLTPLRSREKGLALRKLLNTPPSAGSNTFMFAHGGILWNATDYDSVESETFVFRPSPVGQPPQLVAAIRIEDWPKLVRGEACCAQRAFWSGQGQPPVD